MADKPFKIYNLFEFTDADIEELFMGQPYKELKKLTEEQKARTQGIPHTDLWAGPTQEGGGPLSGVGQAQTSGQWSPEKAIDLSKQAAFGRVEELRSDLKRKLDAMYREQQAAMRVVQDYEGRIQRLNILIDDLR